MYLYFIALSKLPPRVDTPGNLRKRGHTCRRPPALSEIILAKKVMHDHGNELLPAVIYYAWTVGKQRRAANNKGNDR